MFSISSAVLPLWLFVLVASLCLRVSSSTVRQKTLSNKSQAKLFVVFPVKNMGLFFISLLSCSTYSLFILRVCCASHSSLARGGLLAGLPVLLSYQFSSRSEEH